MLGKLVRIFSVVAQGLPELCPNITASRLEDATERRQVHEMREQEWRETRSSAGGGGEKNDVPPIRTGYSVGIEADGRGVMPLSPPPHSIPRTQEGGVWLDAV